MNFVNNCFYRFFISNLVVEYISVRQNDDAYIGVKYTCNRIISAFSVFALG